MVSPNAQLTSAGRYCWRAVYSGDEEVGVPGSSDSTVGECFRVTPVTPALPTVAGDDVTLGNPVTDTGNLSGTASQPGSPIINGPLGAAAGGTITFTLVKKSDCSTLATSNNPAELNPQTVNVSGDAAYPVSFTPNAGGDYSWKATYSGNLPNTLGITSNANCTDTAEDVTVISLQPSMTTAQRFRPNDSATVTVASGGGNLAGTVRFELFVGSATCANTAVYDATFNIVTQGTGPL